MGYHELKHQIREIMRTLEAAALVNATDPLPRCLAEATFAAQYLLKADDLIPDSVPGGLADDAILVKSVVARHGRKLARSGWDFDCACTAAPNLLKPERPNRLTPRSRNNMAKQNNSKKCSAIVLTRARDQLIPGNHDTIIDQF